MSDEESFVILGSTPTPSLEAYNVSDTKNSIGGDDIMESSNDELKSIAWTNMNLSQVSNPQSAQGLGSISEKDGVELDSSLTGVEKETDSPRTSDNLDARQAYQQPSSSKNDAENGTMSKTSASSSSDGFMVRSSYENPAASFILGEIDGDILKTSVFSQFPSLCSSETSVQDIVKLQQFMGEYVELKETLRKQTMTMQHYLVVIQQWQKETKEQQSKQKQECGEMIAKLRNENEELRKELNTRVEHIELEERLMRDENKTLVQQVSEKQSLLQNLRAEIERLEQTHMSFEYIKRPDTNAVGGSAHQDGPEYITLSEHNQILREMRHQLSEVTAKNLEFEDMRNIYVDEINSLKVNLVSAEELLKKFQVDIKLLQSKDVEKGQLFLKYEQDKNAMKQEIDILRTQLDVYCKDFEMERNARQDLAGEKEQIMSDLRMLQKRNQLLIEEAQERLNTSLNRKPLSANVSASSSQAQLTSAAANIRQEEQFYTRHTFVCPICDTVFKTLSSLQDHIDGCLDKA